MLHSCTIIRLSCVPLPQTKAEGDEQLQHCLSMVLTSPHAAASLQTLARIINNVLASPHEPKFRTMRLGNAKVGLPAVFRELVWIQVFLPPCRAARVARHDQDCSSVAFSGSCWGLTTIECL